jgi:hypothetical protein
MLFFHYKKPPHTTFHLIKKARSHKTNKIRRVLRPGGELYFSDIYADRRLPAAAMADKEALGECLGGALYTEDYRRMMTRCGFPDFRIVTSRIVDVHDPRLKTLLGGTQFFSRTIRAFKCADLEEGSEDYGQSATYLGTVVGMPHAFFLELAQPFVTGFPTRIDGNTAIMLMQSRFAAHFNVTAAQAHRGRFNGGSSSSSGGGADAMPVEDASGEAEDTPC